MFSTIINEKNSPLDTNIYIIHTSLYLAKTTAFYTKKMEFHAQMLQFFSSWSVIDCLLSSFLWANWFGFYSHWSMIYQSKCPTSIRKIYRCARIVHHVLRLNKNDIIMTNVDAMVNTLVISITTAIEINYVVHGNIF